MKRTTILAVLSFALLITLIVSLFLILKINDLKTDSNKSEPFQSNNFEPLKKKWLIYSDPVGVTKGNKERQKVFQVYSFVHKEYPLVISMENKIWDISLNKLSDVILNIENYIVLNNLEVTNYMISDINDSLVIIQNIETGKSFSVELD